MLGNKEIVSIIFRFLNFGAIIAIVAYIFKKYALGQIKEKLAEKYALFKNLENQRKNLVEQNKIAKKEIEDQDNLFNLLQKKIKAWNKSCENENKLREQELGSVMRSHKERLEKQAINIQQQKLLQEVFPKILADAYKQLDQIFSKKEESTKFLHDIIGYMKKNVK